MRDKKFAPLYTILTLLFEAGLIFVLWEQDASLSAKGMNFEPILDILWPSFLAFNMLILPLIVLTMSRKEGPVLKSLRLRPNGAFHLAIYRFSLGFYLSMGFCMPSLAGDPLNSGLGYGVSSALLPVFLVFLVAVAFWRYFEPTINAIYHWTSHWAGRLFISFFVLAYLGATIIIMYALRQVPGHLPYILGAFVGAYLPLRIYLHYQGRGSILGLILIAGGFAGQQYLLWT